MEFRSKIGHMPTLIQEFVPKECELRITCVGEEVFACRIAARNSDVTADDYRFDTANLEHEPVERPDLVGRMHSYMRSFDLNFGCFDFIVTKSGETIFLEMNPNGQWKWVQDLTGQPIGQAIAMQLMRGGDLGT
jgi:glutathione synthase/RimK-type ligase-like ATP-grasp enzyme